MEDKKEGEGENHAWFARGTYKPKTRIRTLHHQSNNTLQHTTKRHNAKVQDKTKTWTKRHNHRKKRKSKRSAKILGKLLSKKRGMGTSDLSQGSLETYVQNCYQSQVEKILLN